MSRDEQMRQAKQAYYEEAMELLGDLEEALLELESQPDDHELINRVFRSMHTIKGSGAMFGFDDIAIFTHELETVFDQVRSGKTQLTEELLELTLKSRDLIHEMLVQEECDEEACRNERERIVAALRRYAVINGDADAGLTMPGASDRSSEDMEMTVYRIRFKPDERIFMTGTNPLALLEELAELGECQVVARTDDLPDLDRLDPVTCYTGWDIILATSSSYDAIRDVFIFVDDDCELKIHVIDRIKPEQAPYMGRKIGEILLDRGDIQIQDLHAVLQQQLQQHRPLGELLTKAGVVSPEGVESALSEQRIVREVRGGVDAKEAVSSIRVEASKLDKLGDLVGELVIVQARLSQLVAERHDSSLVGVAEELERLSDELRDNTLGIRMLPIGGTFKKFVRLVRDLSRDLGKEIELVTQGGETELDKNVIEKLNDPLVHLLRNSIDHGIEAPHVRHNQGKARKGRIVLSAEHSSGEVVIKIVDDGAGIEPQKIRGKAIERGMISADAVLSDEELLQIVFAPGFSTAQKVSNVSGRGVGMDVVKRGIDALRGQVRLESKPGLGTTVTVKLPLTLAIIDGLQVEVAMEMYVIPLSSVEECVELDRRSLATEVDREMINLRGEAVPFIRLRNWFECKGEYPDIEQIVIVNVQDHHVGLVVDKVIGQHQTVIKSLGRVYRELEGISGATVNGDGSMALIIDVHAMVGAVTKSAGAASG